MLPAMTSVTTNYLEHWHINADRGENIDFQTEMTELTTNLSAKTLFNADIEETQVLANALATSLKYVSSHDAADLNQIPLSPESIAFQKTLDRLDQTIYSIINERRRSGENKGDLLS